MYLKGKMYKTIPSSFLQGFLDKICVKVILNYKTLFKYTVEYLFYTSEWSLKMTSVILFLELDLFLSKTILLPPVILACIMMLRTCFNNILLPETKVLFLWIFLMYFL